MPRLAFFGDLKLPSEMRYVIPEHVRGVSQVHQGVDRARALHMPTSPNFTVNLLVRCFWAPETDYSKAGFRAREYAVRDALITRSEATYPLVWVETDIGKTVSSYSAPTVTCTAHGLSNGDVVLIRRNGQDLYTLGAISSVATNTFEVTAGHAIQNGDDVHLVQAYWEGMIFQDMSAIEPVEAAGDYYAEAVDYRFFGGGTVTYNATSITLD